MRRFLPLLVPPLLLTTAAAAQDRPTPPAMLTLTASADVARAPDQLRLTAGVLTNGASAADAMAANSVRMNSVLAALKAAAIALRDVQTTGLSLSPQYRYQPEQPPILTGYQARNSISIRTGKLGEAGRLVDAVIKAGANEVQGPEFTLANPDAALDEARTAAVAKARARAELYARAAGLKVKRIASISEGGAMADPGPRPLMRSAMAEAAAAPPVQPGELAMVASVTVSFELEPMP
ncbi:SIMPL domain-containing protein [Sandarakinorhabdus sp. AAP62]|uniref:SIMPL domain-containing protein n=1 Tax=Sandarakinorhabdus sp. AAP62 TaxID=1248916 RepID=UPI00031A8C42|nr:SIMPL domain-containing protein [Sandarakinorhabdus sp. AAP62]